MYYPKGMKARVSPVQWSKPYSIFAPTQDSNPGGRIQNHKQKPLPLHTVVILGLKYVEIDTKISLIARTQPEIWKVTQTKHVTLNLEVNRQESNKYLLIFVNLVFENVRNDTKINSVAWIRPEIWCIMPNFSKFFKWCHLMMSPRHEDVSQRQANEYVKKSYLGKVKKFRQFSFTCYKVTSKLAVCGRKFIPHLHYEC